MSPLTSTSVFFKSSHLKAALDGFQAGCQERVQAGPGRSVLETSGSLKFELSGGATQFVFFRYYLVSEHTLQYACLRPGSCRTSRGPDIFCETRHSLAHEGVNYFNIK